MPSSTRVPLIYGAAHIGAVGSPNCKISDLSDAQTVLDVFIDSGHVGIDTSQLYCGGTSEEWLPKLNLKSGRIDTKIYPLAPGDHGEARLRDLFQRSLKSLNGTKIRIFYLHAPDRSVPFQETLKVINEFYRAGHFEQFGLSNYNSWEVAEIVGICKSKSYVLPTIYQGVYNCLDRNIELELVPCLRKFGIKFAAYSPLAGGFLLGLYLDKDMAEAEDGSHFSSSSDFGWWYKQRYGPTIPATRELRDVAVKHDLSLLQVAIRWLQHHSILTPDDLGIIYGGTKPDQLRKTLNINEEGPLPDEVVKAADTAYAKVKGGLPHYAI